jgi:hypothetical protein
MITERTYFDFSKTRKVVYKNPMDQNYFVLTHRVLFDACSSFATSRIIPSEYGSDSPSLIRSSATFTMSSDAINTNKLELPKDKLVVYMWKQDTKDKPIVIQPDTTFELELYKHLNYEIRYYNKPVLVITSKSWDRAVGWEIDAEKGSKVLHINDGDGDDDTARMTAAAKSDELMRVLQEKIKDLEKQLDITQSERDLYKEITINNLYKNTDRICRQDQGGGITSSSYTYPYPY